MLRALIDRGKGIEINTAGLRRGLPASCPPACVVNWFGEMGGHILTLGSDAHRPQDIGAHLGVALEMARQAGFTRLATFKRRQPILIDCAVAPAERAEHTAPRRESAPAVSEGTML